MSTALLIRSHYHSHNHDADAHIPRSTPPQRARAFVGLELLATCADLGFNGRLAPAKRLAVGQDSVQDSRQAEALGDGVEEGEAAVEHLGGRAEGGVHNVSRLRQGGAEHERVRVAAAGAKGNPNARTQ
eukprot:346947-Prorocentrum_minimum.AAC.1